MRVWLLTALLILSGCQEKMEVDVSMPRPRLVSDQEIKELEAGLLAEVAKNQGKQCPRPVLRGKPLPGSSAEKIVALVEGTPDLKKCRELLKTHADLLVDNLLYPEESPPAEAPSRNTATAREITKPGPELMALDKACLPMIARIREAVRYQDACSPFRPGLRGMPQLLALIHAIRYAAWRARTLLSGGRPAEGFDLLLDCVRLVQDFSRGGTSVLEPMVAAGALRSVLPVIEQGLNRPDVQDPKLLARVESELAQLIETQPHPESFLRGESQNMRLYALLPGMKGDDWTPPGGWGSEDRPPTFTTGEFGLDNVEGSALALIAIRETGQAWLSGCKAESLPIDCYRHMQKLGRELQENSNASPENIAGLLKVAFAEDKAKEIRRQIVQILKSIASPAFDKYVAKDGQVRFSLAALRVQAAYRRLAEKNKSCPGLAAFDRPPFIKLRSDPYSGDQILVKSSASGRFELRAPVFLGKQVGDPAEPAVFVRCPYAK